MNCTDKKKWLLKLCPLPKEILPLFRQSPAVGSKESLELRIKSPHTCFTCQTHLRANQPQLPQELYPISGTGFPLLLLSVEEICWTTTGRACPIIIWEALSPKNSVKSQEIGYISNSLSTRGKIIRGKNIRGKKKTCTILKMIWGSVYIILLGNTLGGGEAKYKTLF